MRRVPALSSLTLLAAVVISMTAGCTHSVQPPARQTVPGSARITSAQPATSGHLTASAPTRTGMPPRFAHIVIVVLENHSNSEIIGNSQAPYLNTLIQQGLRLTQSFAITHPSQPNYLALFSGSTQHVTSDACPVTLSGPNLASALIAAGDTFVGYSESLPEAGYTGCSAGAYARKHNPWADFAGLPASINQPFTAFPADYNRLPTVAFVMPNLDHDMHDGTIAQADHWLATHLGHYANWTLTHHSLLIITWDEDNGTSRNQIPTILYGAGLFSGTDSQRVTHYTLLRTIEDDYRLEHLGATGTSAPLTGTWQP